MHERLPIRGGNWNNGARAGVFALNLNNARSNANTNIGFRPASGDRQKGVPQGAHHRTPSKGPAILGQAPKNMNRSGWRSSPRRRPLAPTAPIAERVMAKTINNVFSGFASFDGLLRAWHRTARGRRSQRDVVAFRAQLEPNLLEIQNSLLHKTYRTGPYHRFHVFEPKRREISSLPLKDRIVQHALVAAFRRGWSIRTF